MKQNASDRVRAAVDGTRRSARGLNSQRVRSAEASQTIPGATGTCGCCALGQRALRAGKAFFAKRTHFLKTHDQNTTSLLPECCNQKAGPKERRRRLKNEAISKPWKPILEAQRGLIERK